MAALNVDITFWPACTPFPSPPACRGVETERGHQAAFALSRTCYPVDLAPAAATKVVWALRRPSQCMRGVRTGRKQCTALPSPFQSSDVVQRRSRCRVAALRQTRKQLKSQDTPATVQSSFPMAAWLAVSSRPPVQASVGVPVTTETHQDRRQRQPGCSWFGLGVVGCATTRWDDGWAGSPLARWTFRTGAITLDCANDVAKSSLPK